MADNLMDAFLLQVDEDDSIRMELDRRIMGYAGDPALITRDVLVPFARELGYDMTVEGDVRVLLEGERTALNYLQRMSGIATYTAQVVHLLEGSDRH